MTWSDGILECWNTENPRLAELDLILYGWHGAENKIRLSSAFDLQYSIFTAFHYSMGSLAANTTPLSEL
jgi:hypothetical protein